MGAGPQPELHSPLGIRIQGALGGPPWGGAGRVDRGLVAPRIVPARSEAEAAVGAWPWGMVLHGEKGGAGPRRATGGWPQPSVSLPG